MAGRQLRLRQRLGLFGLLRLDPLSSLDPATRELDLKGTGFTALSVTREMLNESMGTYVETYRHVDTAILGKLTLPGDAVHRDRPGCGSRRCDGR